MAEVVELQKLKVGNTIILSLLYIWYTFISEHNAKSLVLTDQVSALAIMMNEEVLIACWH